MLLDRFGSTDNGLTAFWFNMAQRAVDDAEGVGYGFAAISNRSVGYGSSEADAFQMATTLAFYSAGDGDDTVNASSEDSIMDGGRGIDVLRGGSGQDIILGGAGNDRLYGRAGNDTLTDGTGNDTLSGEAGNDTYEFTGGDG